MSSNGAGRDVHGAESERRTELTRELLALYVSGDSQAERRLFESHRARLVRQAASDARMRFLRSFTGEEDLVNETLMRALRSGLLGTRFEDRGRGSLRKALYAVLDCVINDECRHHGALKRRANAGAVSFDDEGSDATRAGAMATSPAANDPSPTSNARAAELLELCREHLEPHEWKVWQMAEVHGLKSPEIAEKLGLSASAVRGLLFRSRMRLVEILGETLNGRESDPRG